MLEEKQIICINCPMGCRMTVGVSDGKVVSVQGNTCKRGEEFACQEAVEPMRILTSLMRVEGRDKPFSVKPQLLFRKGSSLHAPDRSPIIR